MPKLLYLAPQPRDTDAIDALQDVMNIAYHLGQLGLGSKLQVLEKLNPRFNDLPIWLTQEMPQLVHFVGHGTRLSKLVFVKSTGHREDIVPEAVAKLFATHATKAPVRGIVLNTCYSLPVAESLVASADFVVANAGEIQDESAVRFAEIFYPLLVKGETLQLAFDHGVAQVLATRTSTQGTPILLMRKGLDATKYLLSGRRPRKLVFLHYHEHAAEDRRLAGELITMLQAHKIPYWSVDKIPPGARRAEQIADALSRATDFVPLLSSDAQADAEGRGEWPKILQQGIARALAGDVLIHPIFLRPTLLPKELEEFQLFPPGKKAVSQYKQRDAIWVKLVEILRGSIDGEQGAAGSAEDPEADPT